jgi:hypothetical protein
MERDCTLTDTETLSDLRACGVQADSVKRPAIGTPSKIFSGMTTLRSSAE